MKSKFWCEETQAFEGTWVCAAVYSNEIQVSEWGRGSRIISLRSATGRALWDFLKGGANPDSYFLSGSLKFSPDFFARFSQLSGVSLAK